MTHSSLLVAQQGPVKLGVHGVSKAYRLPDARGSGGIQQVLKDVSFDIRENEIVSLIGESGCGKTTLLRIVHGLIQRDRGDITVDGSVVSGPGADRGIVFQQPSLLPWRTARRNVEFGLEIAGTPRSRRRERAAELLELIGLSRFADRYYPHQLSGGMQQRVGLARALAIDPEVLLMDEPFSALDAQTREVLQAELLRIHGATKMTVLFVTHDLDEAVYLSDRIVVLAAHPGRVKEIVEVPFERPRLDLPTLRTTPEFAALRTHIWNLIRPAEQTAPSCSRGEIHV